MKDYEIIEHTADIGIRVRADDLKELFQKAARAMFEIIAEENLPSGPRSARNVTIRQKAEDLEELFVNWLNELLSLSAAKEMIFSDFKIGKLDNNHLQAIATGQEIKNYRVNTEIKAATYCGLKLEETKSGWQAEVIFDV